MIIIIIIHSNLKINLGILRFLFIEIAMNVDLTAFMAILMCPQTLIWERILEYCCR